MLERIRFTARNRLCIRVRYDGIERLSEPYSLRHPDTGNRLIYVHERTKASQLTDQIKAYDLAKIQAVTVTDTPFKPRWQVEL